MQPLRRAQSGAMPLALTHTHKNRWPSASKESNSTARNEAKETQLVLARPFDQYGAANSFNN